MNVELKKKIIDTFGPSISLLENIKSDSLTSFKLGGSLDLLAQVKDLALASELISFLHLNNIPWRPLGAGSNLIIKDEGLSDVVIKLSTDIASFKIFKSTYLELTSLNDLSSLIADSRAEFPKNPLGDEILVLATASYSLMSLSRKVSFAGYTGLEFAAGIPASLGGAVVMNAGAHGCSMSDIVEKVYVLNYEGRLECLSKEKLDFSYRHSSISSNMLVVASELRLRLGDKEEIAKRRARCLDYRKKTQPLNLPSAGSVFTNPEVKELSDKLKCLTDKENHTIYAGKLLESLGLRGERKGGVCFSRLHANWLVKDLEEGSSEDVIYLMDLAKERVLNEYGIELTSEIRIWP